MHFFNDIWFQVSIVKREKLFRSYWRSRSEDGANDSINQSNGSINQSITKPYLSIWYAVLWLYGHWVCRNLYLPDSLPAVFKTQLVSCLVVNDLILMFLMYGWQQNSEHATFILLRQPGAHAMARPCGGLEPPFTVHTTISHRQFRQTIFTFTAGGPAHHGHRQESSLFSNHGPTLIGRWRKLNHLILNRCLPSELECFVSLFDLFGILLGGWLPPSFHEKLASEAVRGWWLGRRFGRECSKNISCHEHSKNIC